MSITITSTTDGQAEVNQALAHDEAVGRAETPKPDAGHVVSILSTTNSQQEVNDAFYHQPVRGNSGTVTVASTTDSQSAIDEAADYGGDTITAADDEGEGHITPVVMSEDKSVASTTDDQESVEQAAEDLQQEKSEKPDYLDHTRPGRRKLAHQVARQAAQIEELRQRLATYEGGQEAQPLQAEDNYSQQPPQPQPQPVQQPQPPQPQMPQQPQMPLNPQVDPQFAAAWNAATADLPARMAEAQQRIPDLQQALDTLDREHPISKVAVLHVSTLPNPGDVGYYLSEHPEVTSRMWAMEAAGRGDLMLNELNQISAGLAFNTRNGTHGTAARSAVPHEQRPAAPKPIRRVGGGISSSAGDPNQMDMRSYNEWRNSGGGR